MHMRTLAALLTGYGAYYLVNTEKGRELAKSTMNCILKQAGTLDDAVTRAVLKAVNLDSVELPAGTQDETAHDHATVQETHDHEPGKKDVEKSVEVPTIHTVAKTTMEVVDHA